MDNHKEDYTVEGKTWYAYPGLDQGQPTYLFFSKFSPGTFKLLNPNTLGGIMLKQCYDNEDITRPDKNIESFRIIDQDPGLYFKPGVFEKDELFISWQNVNDNLVAHLNDTRHISDYIKANKK